MNTLQASHPAASSSKGGMNMDMELDNSVHHSTSNGNGNGSGNGRQVVGKSLDDYGFITGDYLSVSLYIPEPKLPQSAPTNSNNNNGGPHPPISRDREMRIQGTSAPSNGEWARGEALPPRTGRGGYNGNPRDRDHGNRGSARDGGHRNAPGPPGVMGIGIRGGAGRRSPSVGRDRNGGGGGGRRSRSPEPSRRRERSP